MSTQNTNSNTNPFIAWLESIANESQETLDTLCQDYGLPKPVIDALTAHPWLKPSSLTLLSVARKRNMDSEALAKVIELTEPDPFAKMTREFVELSRIYEMLPDELRNDLMDAARLKAELHFKHLATADENRPEKLEPDEKVLNFIENFYYSVAAVDQQAFLDMVQVMNQPFPQIANKIALSRADEENMEPFYDSYYH